MIEIDKPKLRQESPAPYLKDGPSVNDVGYYYRKVLEAFTQKEKEQQKEQES